MQYWHPASVRADMGRPRSLAWPGRLLLGLGVLCLVITVLHLQDQQPVEEESERESDGDNQQRLEGRRLLLQEACEAVRGPDNVEHSALHSDNWRRVILLQSIKASSRYYQVLAGFHKNQ